MSSRSFRLIRSCTVRRSFRKPLRSSSAGQLVDGPQPPVAQVVDVVDVGRRLVGAAACTRYWMAAIEVVGPQRHLRLRGCSGRLAVDAEAADAAQPVAVGVEELLVEQGPGLLQLRRVARPQPLVNPQQRLFVAGRGVVGQGVQEQRALRRRPSPRPASGPRCRSSRRRSS